MGFDEKYAVVQVNPGTGGLDGAVLSRTYIKTAPITKKYIKNTRREKNGNCQNQKKEIERKNQQIELLKHSIGGRDQEIAILRGQELAAQALIGAVVKNTEKLEIPLEEVEEKLPGKGET